MRYGEQEALVSKGGWVSGVNGSALPRLCGFTASSFPPRKPTSTWLTELVTAKDKAA